MEVKFEINPTDETPHDWEAAATIVYKLYHMIDELEMLAIASKGFTDCPPGIEGLRGLLIQVSERWHEFTNTLAEKDETNG
jgi:hypothetical protein